ncbi:hypothetical protein BJV82DRAFT_665045 [Fennellomyces sp. T-0311]|nr:hypothetical protein BJV82DRAFT_665045 [Fennellomyces sp. T-0311]
MAVPRHQLQQPENYLSPESNATASVSAKARFDLLPIEIQHRIFEQLSFQDCVRASNVSRSWHSHSLRRPSLWRSISFDNCESVTTRNLLPYCQQKYVQSTYVRELHISNAFGKRLSDIFTFANEQEWKDIEKVTLKHARLNLSVPKFLDTISSRLTSLELKFIWWDFSRELLPDSLLKSCPQLVSLHYSTTLHDDLWDNYKYIDQPHEHLIDLAISIRQRSWHGYMMHRLLQSLPKLRRLSIVPDKQEDPEPILATISQSCPDLECFNLVSRISDLRTSGPVPMTDGVLRELVVDDVKDTWYAYANALNDAFIAKYCKTLECLDISGYWFVGPTAMKNLAPFSFPGLNMLYLSDNQGQPQPEKVTRHLCAFLRHTPELIYADFKAINSVTDAVLRTLRAHANLEILCLDRCREISSIGLGALVKSNNYLVELKLHNIDGFTDDIFGMIAKELPSLRVLDIVACQNISLAGLDTFLNNLENSEPRQNKLRKLVVEYVKPERGIDVDWAIELLLSRLNKYVIQWRFARPSPPKRESKYEEITDQQWKVLEQKAIIDEKVIIYRMKNLSISDSR